LSGVYCSKCGMMNSEDSEYCRRCGNRLRFAPAQDTFGDRRHHRHDHSHTGFGALIVGAIIIVAGLGVFLPDIPWDLFWATMLVLLGTAIIGAFLYRKTTKQQ
jgi:hypothetical protein